MLGLGKLLSSCKILLHALPAAPSPPVTLPDRLVKNTHITLSPHQAGLAMREVGAENSFRGGTNTGMCKFAGIRGGRRGDGSDGGAVAAPRAGAPGRADVGRAVPLPHSRLTNGHLPGEPACVIMGAAAVCICTV